MDPMGRYWSVDYPTLKNFFTFMKFHVLGPNLWVVSHPRKFDYKSFFRSTFYTLRILNRGSLQLFSYVEVDKSQSRNSKDFF